MVASVMIHGINDVIRIFVISQIDCCTSMVLLERIAAEEAQQLNANAFEGIG